MIETGTEQRFEEPVTGPEGQRISLSTEAPLRDAEGRIADILGVTKNITGLRRRNGTASCRWTRSVAG